MKVLYTLSIFLYLIVIRIAALYSEKARKWLNGRKDWKTKLQAIDLSEKVIWIHVASYGEFEQGKPVIEKLKTRFPSYKLLLTFFSPSGFEKFKNYPDVDVVFYLPLDTPANAKEFIRIVKPSIALFVRYEFWFNYLEVLNKHKIPFIYFSASFRSNQIYFKPFGRWFLQQFKACSSFLVRDSESGNVLRKNGLLNYKVVGDTRFDSVFENSIKEIEVQGITEFKDEKPLVVFGSTWDKDQELILNYLNQKTQLNFRVIIAPHEIQEDKILYFQKKLTHKSTLYSKSEFKGFEVLIIDSIGLLKNIYRYADLSYVGGGFGSGIHNLLEPAIFGKPVLFGPNNQKFLEAKEMKAIGIAHEVNEENFSLKIDKLLFTNNSKITDLAKVYFNQHIGTSKEVLEEVKQVLIK